MKKKPVLGATAGIAIWFAAFAAPQPSSGQAGNENQLVAQLLGEVAAQQKLITDRQTLLEEKTALIAEDIRIARIFAGRSGGKVAPK